MDTDTAGLPKPRNRPISRASTASNHSIGAPSNVEQPFPQAPHGYPGGQWATNAQRYAAAPTPGLQIGGSMGPESGMPHGGAHLQQTGRSFSISQATDGTMSHPSPYQHSGRFDARSMSVSLSMNDGDSFAGGTDVENSQMLESKNEGVGEGLPVAGQKTSSRTAANNEREMQQLFVANKHRSLQDVARELHGNERGPNSERQRQVFAMLWINQVCSWGKGSVPRGRVYANYASRCATERITVLNPASFGKLVRVLFPDLKTRRLGVRGESKYHYVNFSLVDDQPDLAEPESQEPLLPDVSGFSLSTSSAPQAAPSTVMGEKRPRPPPEVEGVGGPPPAQRRKISHSLYNVPSLTSVDQLHSTTSKTFLDLHFSTPGDEQAGSSDPIILPRIEPFLPHGTDPDAAKSLAALYRSHCTSLVECIRYCKEKTFFHLFTSFQGTLTTPVQKVFALPSVARWIEECDFMLYQRMMRIIAALTLQVVPKAVLDTLRSISERLVPHIRDAFQVQPDHVVRAKEAPATIFAALIDRALRVNLTAHAAANMLSNPANRDQMYHDWISIVRVRKVAECVPTRGMDDLVKVLLSEIRDLLDPVDVQWDFECMTIYGEIATRSPRQNAPGGKPASTSANALDRWVTFLRSLPGRFPYASATDIVWCVQRVGTAVMRDLTLAQGKSFGSWWVTKCWVDEMVSFMAEHGGFMKQKNTQESVPAENPQAATKESNKPSGPRYSSGSDDFQLPNLAQQQPGKAKAPMGGGGGGGQDSLDLDGNMHDDSGIGIATPDEEFPMEKYGFPATEASKLLNEVSLHNGSGPSNP